MLPWSLDGAGVYDDYIQSLDFPSLSTEVWILLACIQSLYSDGNANGIIDPHGIWDNLPVFLKGTGIFSS